MFYIEGHDLKGNIFESAISSLYMFKLNSVIWGMEINYSYLLIITFTSILNLQCVWALSLFLLLFLSVFLYSLSGNKALCGVPTLPACSFFWERGKLSTAGKIAIGLSCGVVLSVLILTMYICWIRRGKNDYDFGLPHDLMCKCSFHALWSFIFTDLSSFSHILKIFFLIFCLANLLA